VEHSTAFYVKFEVCGGYGFGVLLPQPDYEKQIDRG
jgi:hypothetical protein